MSDILQALDYIDVLPKDERRAVRALLLRLAEVTAKEQSLTSFLVAKLEADKTTLDGYSKVFLQDKTRLEGDVLALKAQLHATEAMRPIVEILSKMACPSPSATQSVKRLCNGLVQGSALVAHAQVWLSQLESQTVDQRSVVKELQNLHHELSRDHHYVDMTKSSLRSGELPLRAAVALAILEAQRLLANTPAGTLPHEDVFYTDENGQQLHVLHNSTVV